MKSVFGDDSSQYEVVGGTRLGDRKPRKRKKEGRALTLAIEDYI